METALKGGEGKVLNAGDRGGGEGGAKYPGKVRGGSERSAESFL